MRCLEDAPMMFLAFRATAAAMLALLALAACKPSSIRDEVFAPDPQLASLRAEVARLREENAQLRLSPNTLAAEVDNAIRTGNEEKAAAAFKQLSDTFPVAAETAEMRKRLETFLAQRRAQEEDEKRIAALGFKALPITPSVSHDNTVLAINSVAVV